MSPCHLWTPPFLTSLQVRSGQQTTSSVTQQIQWQCQNLITKMSVTVALKQKGMQGSSTTCKDPLPALALCSLTFVCFLGKQHNPGQGRQLLYQISLATWLISRKSWLTSTIPPSHSAGVGIAAAQGTSHIKVGVPPHDTQSAIAAPLSPRNKQDLCCTQLQLSSRCQMKSCDKPFRTDQPAARNAS